jgi:hypothetical protein
MRSKEKIHDIGQIKPGDRFWAFVLGFGFYGFTGVILGFAGYGIWKILH